MKLKLLSFLIIPLILIMIVPQSYAQVSEQTMFVTSPNYELDGVFGGATVMQVMISDPNISSVDEPRGYPDVTVNGKDLVMAQGLDGNWYGYFASKIAAQQADATVNSPGTGSDFGEFCRSDSSEFTSWYYSSLDFTVPRDYANGANGLELPADCIHTPGYFTIVNNVLKNYSILNNHPETGHGQIMMDARAWPLISLVELPSVSSAYIQYSKAGNAEIIDLDYDVNYIPTSTSPQNKICDDEYLGYGTYKSISVAQDAICVIDNVTVQNNVIADNTDIVNISNSNIGKNLKFKNSDAVSINVQNVQIGANLVLKNLSDVSINNIRDVTVDGDFKITDNTINDSDEISENEFGGNMIMLRNTIHGDLDINRNNITKNMILLDNDGDSISWIIEENIISENLVIRNNKVNAIEIGDNQVSEKLKVKNNQLGDLSLHQNISAKKTVVKNNSIDNFWFIQNNSAINKIFGNTIFSHMWCGGNSLEPIMKGNTVNQEDANTCTNY